MAITYLITGATGHLGLHVVRILCEQKQKTRVLVSSDDPHENILPEDCRVFHGEITDKASMEEFFDCSSQDDIYVIHCAEAHTMSNRFDQHVWDVNVVGTQNIIDMCRLFHVKRLVYVSSVQAISENTSSWIITEPETFETDKVKGLYAKTKAVGTQLVLQQASDDLSVSVVLPSALLGPDDYDNSPITSIIEDTLKGRFATALEGGYDFVDVRDVAAGVVKCAEKGENGASYILSNQFFSVKYILDMVAETDGIKTVPLTMPNWMMKMSSPVMGVYYNATRRKAMYTEHAMELLTGNSNFSHRKADDDLGYTTRDIADTIRDTVAFIKNH